MDEEIFNYITDERILRVLFELKIFKLRDIQIEAIKKGLYFRKSFLICAPSGSGKTLIGELCAINNVFQEYGKSIYLVPFKALATEKYFHFKKCYDRFNVRTELSIGDHDVDDKKLSKADIIVTTYEKCDSILRNCYDKDWIFDISTIIIDEIHIIGEESRGPRLESLIIRLNEFLNYPQIIGLSATIANPKFVNSWLSSLENDTRLILSDKRPVPLHYKIEISRNKDSTIKRIIRTTLEQKGQVFVFLVRRLTAQSLGNTLKDTVKKFLSQSELDYCKSLSDKLAKIKGGNVALQKTIKYGVAFHHAGLLPKERRLVENNYIKKKIKVICCTTTLSAGINMPARVVILKDFKKFTRKVDELRNYSGFYEEENGFSYFKPFSANEVFQMLGRAGRPGLDSIGIGYILPKDAYNRSWAESHYFQNSLMTENYIPKYNNLVSGLNKINTLKEQVLLRIYEEKNITVEKLKRFFEKTFFWFSIKNSSDRNEIPIDQLLMIKEITPINILKLHSQPIKVKLLRKRGYSAAINDFSPSNISGHIKTDYGVFSCQFDTDSGVKCSCGFANGASDNYASKDFSFEFCDHITLFLIYLIELPDLNFQKYINDIVPRAVKDQYILNYLFEKGLIIRNDDETIKCSHFGKLIIRLYLYPNSGVLIRKKLEHNKIDNYKDLIQNGYDVLRSEGRLNNNKFLEPLLEWADEEPVEKILSRHKIMTGDLYSKRDNLERVINFIGIIASHLSSSGLDLQDRLVKVAEMAETLRIRLHHGIKEELFDLVIRINNVGRVRGRILYNAGYRIASQVANEKPYVLSRKTGFGVDFCKDIITSLKNTSDEE